MSGPPHTGPDRRSGSQDRRGRPVYAHGPIIRTLEVVSALSSVAALAALVVAAVAFQSTIATLQHSRRQAATDSCRVLHRLVDNAYPVVDRRRANIILARSGLGGTTAGCRRYAVDLVRLKGAH